VLSLHQHVSGKLIAKGQKTDSYTQVEASTMNDWKYAETKHKKRDYKYFDFYIKLVSEIDV
jgi:hypothetical protein